VSVYAWTSIRECTDQKDDLLFKTYRYLQNKRKRDDEHEHIRRDVESSLNDSIVIKDHTVQGRRRSDLPIVRERCTLRKVGDLTRYIADCNVDGENLDCDLLPQTHTGI
jgi:hypothetical protein